MAHHEHSHGRWDGALNRWRMAFHIDEWILLALVVTFLFVIFMTMELGQGKAIILPTPTVIPCAVASPNPR